MLKLDNTALAIVDIQGKLAGLMHEKDKLFENAIKMIKGAQVLELPILWNEQVPDKLGETIPQVKKLFAQIRPMSKSSFSCCGNEDFIKALTQTRRKQIIVIGIETHICVYQTVIDLLNASYEVYVAADAVSSRTMENKHIGLTTMKDAGAKITSVEMSLFEILRKAGGDRFKQISKIVK
ncbi:MAG: hydrolase [candidate division Zixibacteria bacterium]